MSEVWLRLAVNVELWQYSSSLGNLRSLNELAKAAKADYILHTGDFGFYDENSLDRIADK